MSIPNVFIRTPYNYDRSKVSRETGLTDDSPSLTQQSFKDECDINTLVKRFGITGAIPQGVRAPSYADYDEVFDYQDAMNAIAAANSSFAELSAIVRRRFHNDPAEFVDFCSDPNNLDEMRKLGLAIPAPVVSNTTVVTKESSDETELPDDRVRSGKKPAGEPKGSPSGGG